MTSSFLPYLMGNFLCSCAAGFVLASEKLLPEEGEEPLIGFTVLYLLCVLTLLLPFGILCDLTHSNGRIPAGLGCLVSAAGLWVSHSSAQVAVIVLAVGTALFAAGGLCDALTQNAGVTRLGLFVSFAFPGHVIGAVPAGVKHFPTLYFSVLLLFCALLVFTFCRHPRESFRLPEDPKPQGFSQPMLPGRAAGFACLLPAVLCCVFAQSAASHPAAEGRLASLLPAFALFGGWFVGGILCDLIGSKIVSPAALLCAAVLFWVGKDRFILYCGALFLSALALPSLAAYLTARIPGREGLAGGLCGLSAATAYVLPALLLEEITLPAPVLPLCCALAALLAFGTLGRNRTSEGG